VSIRKGVKHVSEVQWSFLTEFLFKLTWLLSETCQAARGGVCVVRRDVQVVARKYVLRGVAKIELIVK